MASRAAPIDIAYVSGRFPPSFQNSRWERNLSQKLIAQRQHTQPRYVYVMVLLTNTRKHICTNKNFEAC